jgi:hypothetical protein
METGLVELLRLPDQRNKKSPAMQAGLSMRI